MTISREKWGTLPDGRSVELISLVNDSGFEASISTYGGIVTRLLVPDGSGKSVDVTLGYDTLDEYLNDSCYFGCLVGRVANRISYASFGLDGTIHTLDQNHGDHQLHGGARGFNTRLWQAEIGETVDGPCLTLSRTSPDGEQGYPGTLDVSVAFTLMNEGLRLDFSATTDAPTTVSLTNHSYFNLSGEADSDCLNHEVRIASSRYLETDEMQLPTGQLALVAGTPMDFRKMTPVGQRVSASHEALDVGKGYDHFYVLDDEEPEMRLAAEVHDPKSDRHLEVWTTYPGVQLYSGNHISQALPGKGGLVYGPHSGLCLEAHGFVDAPNQPGFPSMRLDPEERYSETTLYKFCVK